MLDDVGAGLVHGEFQVRYFRLFELRLPAHGGDEFADQRQVFSGRRDLQGKFSFEGSHLESSPDRNGAAGTVSKSRNHAEKSICHLSSFIVHLSLARKSSSEHWASNRDFLRQ